MISRIPKWVGNLFEALLLPNVKILQTSYLSPHIKKIRFQGDLSKMNFQIGYASVIRVSETEYRNYSVAYHDAKAGILDIIFHIHGNGVGSRYVDTLKTGDDFYIGPSRGIKVYDPKVKQHFIFGDETSLGLACSFLPVLKQNEHEFQFYFELDEENQHVPPSLGLENCSLFLKNGSFSNEKRISNLPVFQNSDWQAANFILAGNVKSVQTFRKALKSYTKGKIYAQGYWLEGKKGL